MLKRWILAHFGNEHFFTNVEKKPLIYACYEHAEYK